MILIDQKISCLALSAWEVHHSVAPPYHCPAFSFSFLLQFSGVLTFLEIEFSRAFSHHHHPGDSSLSASEPGWGSFEGQRLETGKCQKLRRGSERPVPPCFCLECLFVCILSAKEGCNIPRDALERMFTKRVTKRLLSFFVPSIVCKLCTLHNLD